MRISGDRQEAFVDPRRIGAPVATGGEILILKGEMLVHVGLLDPGDHRFADSRFSP